MSHPQTQSSAHTDPTSASSAPVSPVHLLEGVIEPVLEAMGYELVHLEWAASGGRRRIRAYVDHPDGVGLDDCARLSPIISNALDAAEVESEATGLARLLAHSYVLEVSSPGLDRPLSRRHHFERYIGRRVTVRTTEPVERGSKQKTFHAELEGVEPDPDRPDDPRCGAIIVRTPEDGSVHRIPLELLRRANLVPQPEGPRTGQG